MKKIPRFAMIFLGVTLFMCIYFSNNIWAHLRFESLCRTAGMHTYLPLERNVGWSSNATSVGDTNFLRSLGTVAFVRFLDSEGVIYDVRAVERTTVNKLGYIIEPANFEMPVVYQWNYRDKRMPDEVRTSEIHSEVIQISTGKVAVRYVEFTHSIFNPDRTILAAPSGERCPANENLVDRKTGDISLSKKKQAFLAAFGKMEDKK